MKPDPRLYQIATLASLLGYGLFRLDFDLPPVQVASMLGTALLTQFACTRLWRLPAFDPGGRLLVRPVARLKFDRHAKSNDGRIQVAELRQVRSEVVVGDMMPGVDANRLAVRSNGRGGVALGVQSGAKAVLGACDPSEKWWGRGWSGWLASASSR